MPIPSIGRIVHYRVNAEMAEEAHDMNLTKDKVKAGEWFPALVIVSPHDAHEKGIGVHVFLPGAVAMYHSNCQEGVEEGNWRWPPRD